MLKILAEAIVVATIASDIVVFSIRAIFMRLTRGGWGH
jgi:hypothetical protein